MIRVSAGNPQACVGQVEFKRLIELAAAALRH
jgi:hypothetical protein